MPPADVIADAKQPLPFSDREFSCVVLADVLEHLDDPHAALDEAMRVGKSAVVLLPNMFALEHRLSFLRGKLDTSKYDFGPDNPRDGHRWLMNHDQARDFTRAVAAEAGWRVAREVAAAAKSAKSLGRVGVWIEARPPFAQPGAPLSRIETDMPRRAPAAIARSISGGQR